MAMETSLLAKSTIPMASAVTTRRRMGLVGVGGGRGRFGSAIAAVAIDNSGGGIGNKVGILSSTYVVPFDKAPTLTRPLDEILRDLNKRVPDNLIKNNSISWYHANRMLSFYAPGWCGEICDVIYSDNGSVTVVYRVTIRGTDGEVHRESTGTVFLSGGSFEDPVAAAEEIAFCRACARFGLGLHLYHEDSML